MYAINYLGGCDKILSISSDEKNILNFLMKENIHIRQTVRLSLISNGEDMWVPVHSLFLWHGEGRNLL